VNEKKKESENGERKFRVHDSQFRDIGKAQRKAIAKEKRKVHRDKLIETRLRYFGQSKAGIPKIVVLIALSPNANTSKVEQHLLQHCNVQQTSNQSQSAVECQAVMNGSNQKSNYLIYRCQDREDMYCMLDMCKIADIILLIAAPSASASASSSGSTASNEQVLGLDEKSKVLCSLIKAVGGGSGGTTIYGLYQPAVFRGMPKKYKSQQCKLEPSIKQTFLNYLHHQFGTSNNSKNIRIFHAYDTPQVFRFMHDCKHYNDSNAVNCEWKQKRPHLLIQNIAAYDPHSNVLQIDGHLRGSIKLNINRPIHITGLDGHYLIQRVDGLLDAPRHQQGGKKTRKKESGKSNDKEKEKVVDFINGMDEDEEEDDDDDVDAAQPQPDDDEKLELETDESLTLLVAEPSRQDRLEALGSLDGLASQFDQTIITESELKEIEQERQKLMEKQKLQRQGLSDYDAEWRISDDDDGAENDDDDDEMDMDMDAEMNTDEQQEDDDMVALQKKRELEKEDFEFRDEVDTPINVRAKDRFAHYRGLKQFYKTKWDKFELLPVEYSQIANIRDWKQALKRSKLGNLNPEDAEMADCMECGQKVRLYIGGVSMESFDELRCQFAKHKPLIVWSLLQHENKISVCHYLIQKSVDYAKPIEAESTLTFDVGVRRFQCKPIFSDNSKGDKHLVRKFVNDSEFVVASIYGYITYPPINVVAFDAQNDVCCVGNLLSIDAHRLLIKRKVLTGSAIRVQRRRAVIRYMFWNADDVNYFKPIDLWTKHGLKGKIEEAIGEKGYMKCFFNGNVKQHDTVCLSLYKRVFPSKDEKLFTDS